ncbi:ATP-dependent metalloprotease, putative [Pediculus humanus corporis]|uniref:ATP-dependent metalloprotease, putative n=1 Tax=Pediculus humanus subsp. corporis TaxID=121224 RepID=E0VKI1_PEDHC|nr:ATP-dependent metalloprotease, putative [Pediculus humanus corporis]EEB13887.1 ATP-dependent metalloprotease, putative [Pediculus humanus corporis]
MLVLHNLHQVVFNLSQITSAITSRSVCFSSKPVNKKNEIDILCHNSFLQSLKLFQQSENYKVFNNLPNVKFGPKLEDIQWIFFKDFNFKFISHKSDRNHYDNVNSENLSFESIKKNIKSNFCERQSEVLLNVENYLKNKEKWSKSFVSKINFDKNKETSYCGSSENLMKFNKSKIQKRGFKTRRAILSEDKLNQGFFPKNEKKMETANQTSGPNMVFQKADKYIDTMGDENLTAEDKLRSKVSYAEGYLAATNELKKSNTPFSKNNLFSIKFGHPGEVDPETVGVTFSDVKGVDEVKEELQEIVEFLKNPQKFSSMGGTLQKGVLLVGPPGTGKTLLARAIAGEANVPFFHASGSEFDEIFVGEGARRIRNLFKSAKAKAPAIIFIDEIDCVGSKRNSTMLHPYANQTINQLLSEMDGFAKNENVIVLGATNRKSDLDSALLRPGRFDVEVMEILELYVNKIVSKNIDIEKLAKATAGCSGAHLEAIVNHAAIRAAVEGAPFVTMEHIEEAKDKIMIGPKRKQATESYDDNLLTAYHEGGHTVVAYFSDEIGQLDKVTIVPRGGSLGHTSVVPSKDEVYLTKAMCLAKIDVALGGRAAEELIYGPNKITANAADDLDVTTALAASMIKSFGMSEKIGLRTIINSSSTNSSGQSVTDEVDVEVKRLIQESYERAKSILKKHAKEHKLLAEALVKYKTLSPEDVRAILGERVSEKASISGVK